MLEALCEWIWLHSPRQFQYRLSKLAYWICEALCGFTSRNTSCTVLAAGEAIAAIQMLDIEKVLAEPELPAQLREVLPAFTSAEWKEILGVAGLNRGLIAMYLDEQRWSHLRKTPA